MEKKYIIHVIDYSDHYSHTDKKIDPFHFRSYSENEWKRFNHNCHYQNRLSHNDFKKVYTELGLNIIFEKKLKYAFNKYEGKLECIKGLFVMRT